MYNDKLKMSGEVILSICDMSSLEAQKLQDKITKATGEEYRKLVDELHSKFLKRQVVIPNLIPTVGRTVFAMIMAGTFTYDGKINYCALGTNATASANGDTTLGTEVFRKVISSATYSNNITYISTFFTASETDDTYNEVGHFINGEAGVDTGQLFSRIADPETAELPLTKSNTESLTVDYKVTIS